MVVRFSLSEERGVGHGEDEEAFASVRRADFLRCNECCRNRVAHALKVSGDFTESEGQMAADVLEEAPARLEISDPGSDGGPEVAGVVLAPACSGIGERLARVAANEAIHEAAPCPEVEGSQVTPERSRRKVCCFHAVDQERGCRGFVLHEAHCASRSA